MYLNKVKNIFILLVLFLSGSIFSESPVQVWEKSKELVSENKFDEGIRLFEKVLVDNPKDSNIIMGLGYLKYYEGKKYLEKGDLDKAYESMADAKKQFDTAIYLGEIETKIRAYFNKGNCDLVIANELEKTNQSSLKDVSISNLFKEAITSYRKALELDPNFLEARKNLEYALYKFKKSMSEEKRKEQQEKENKEDTNRNVLSTFVNAFTEIPGKKIEIDSNKSNVLHLKDNDKNEGDTQKTNN
ncbi:MAG: hypothetical protein N3G21_04140 [Candidatus Hydrogenedentes bacterium]|nr:hypothetical protein [Candidatus Hydrogenedentota bacterium]